MQISNTEANTKCAKNIYIKLFSSRITIFSEDLCVFLVAGCLGGLEEHLVGALEFTQVTQETFRLALDLSSVCSEPCCPSSLQAGQCLTWQVLIWIWYTIDHIVVEKLQNFLDLVFVTICYPVARKQPAEEQLCRWWSNWYYVVKYCKQVCSQNLAVP